MWEGQFFNNELNGFVRWMNSGGTIYEGYYLNNKKHGFGRSIDKDGNIKQGQWELGNF